MDEDCTSKSPCHLDSAPILSESWYSWTWEICCSKCGAIWWRFKTIRQQIRDQDAAAPSPAVVKKET